MKKYVSTLSLLCLFCLPNTASALEVFAKGSYSKSNQTSTIHTIRLSATGGIAVNILPSVRVDLRYTNVGSLKNLLITPSGDSVTDLKTETHIYALGIDVDLLGPRAPFQPFIYVGAGYLIQETSYYYTVSGSTDSIFVTEGTQNKISGNLGLGFKIRIAASLAFEVEVFAYGIDIDKPNPLIDVYGNVGFRYFF